MSTLLTSPASDLPGPEMAAPTPSACKAALSLHIVDGLHAGASLDLQGPCYHVGSDIGNDVVLMDEGVAPRHLQLVVDESTVHLVRLDGAAIEVNGEPLTEERWVLSPTDTIGIGAARLRLCGVERPEPEAAAQAWQAAAVAAGLDEPDTARRRRWVRRAVVGTSLCAASCVAAAFAWAALDGPATHRPATAARSVSAVAAVATPTAAPDDIWVSRVREFIGDDTLDVLRDAQGHVVVRGRTSREPVKPQIARISKEFEGAVAIVDEVSYVPDKTQRVTLRIPKPITDVHLGDVPWFTTSDGMRFFEGSLWDPDLVVERITMEGIVFRRGDEVLVHRFNG